MARTGRTTNYCFVKKQEVLPFATTRTGAEATTLREVSPWREDKHYSTPLTQGTENRLTEAERRMVVARGCGG